MATRMQNELAPIDTQISTARNAAQSEVGTAPFGDLFGSPWQMMRRMQHDLDLIFNRLMGGEATSIGRSSLAGVWAPRLDISETEKEYLIEAELPGVKPEGIEVEARNGTLCLSAKMEESKETREKRYLHRERHYGAFERVFTLPDGVQADKIRCEFKEGVLHCHLPKSEQAQAKSRGRRIPVETR